MRDMKTCLGSLILVPAILILVGTGAYHASLDAGIKFEERDTNAQYINTERSYRPTPKQEPNDPRKPADAAPAPAQQTPKP